MVLQNDNFLKIAPFTDEYQVADCYQVDTVPQGIRVEYKDTYGNVVHRIRINRPHQELVILSIGKVYLKHPPSSVPEVNLSDIEYDYRSKEFLTPSPLVDPEKVSNAAGIISHNSMGLLESVNRVVTWIYENIEYQRGETSVGTTAEDVLAANKGVCQDKTHLALGMLRAIGIPVRYVSGILTKQAGETHAWLEFLHPTRGWLPADPTRGIVLNLGLSYVKFGVGRDYTEVPPVTGSFVSTGTGYMETAVAQAFFDKDAVTIQDALSLIEPNNS
jgi:transglutaminase-like putative cysteine protease